jgi:hypothetical protein
MSTGSSRVHVVQVGDLVGQDREQPGPERRARAEPVKRAVGLDERVLHHVFGLGAGTHHRGHPQRHRGVTAHQVRVRVPVSVPDAGEHGRIRLVRVDPAAPPFLVPPPVYTAERTTVPPQGRDSWLQR